MGGISDRCVVAVEPWSVNILTLRLDASPSGDAPDASSSVSGGSSSGAGRLRRGGADAVLSAEA